MRWRGRRISTSWNSPPTLASNSPPGPRLVARSDPRKRGDVASLTRASAVIPFSIISPHPPPTEILHKRGKSESSAAKASYDEATG